MLAKVSEGLCYFLIVSLMAAAASGCDSASGPGEPDPTPDATPEAAQDGGEPESAEPAATPEGEPDTGEPDTGEPDTGEPSPSSPVILSFNANTTALTEGETAVFTAVVTDPDGISDVIGGSLETPDGAASYGAFATQADEGAYSFSLSWSAINQVASISFTDESNLEVVARFFDAAGNTVTQSRTLRLHCDGNGACDGVCTNLQSDPNNCGSCERQVGDAQACVAGVPTCEDPEASICGDACVNLQTSREHCGACDSPLPDVETGYINCEAGAPVCSNGQGTEILLCGDDCAYPGTPETCGSCDHNCNDLFSDVTNDEPTCFEQEFCRVWKRVESSNLTCFDICEAYPGTTCGDGSTSVLRLPSAKYANPGNDFDWGWTIDCSALPPPFHPNGTAQENPFVGLECPCFQFE